MRACSLLTASVPSTDPSRAASKDAENTMALFASLSTNRYSVRVLTWDQRNSLTYSSYTSIYLALPVGPILGESMLSANLGFSQLTSSTNNFWWPLSVEEVE